LVFGVKILPERNGFSCHESIVRNQDIIDDFYGACSCIDRVMSDKSGLKNIEPSTECQMGQFIVVPTSFKNPQHFQTTDITDRLLLL
jgi:hypothetical protein